MKMKVGLGIYLVLVTLLAVWGLSRKPKHSIDTIIRPDTVYVSSAPDLTEKIEGSVRTEIRFVDRIAGVDTIVGEGPVIVVEEWIPAYDTAIVYAEINRGRLSPTVQIPDTVGGSTVQLHILPPRDISNCTEVVLGRDGTTRCNKPALGVLTLQGSVGTSVARDGEIEIQDPEIGVGWRPTLPAAWSVNLYVKPTEFFTDEEERLYLEFSYGKDIPLL